MINVLIILLIVLSIVTFFLIMRMITINEKLDKMRFVVYVSSTMMTLMCDEHDLNFYEYKVKAMDAIEKMRRENKE